MAKPIASKDSDQPNSKPNHNHNSKRHLCPSVHCSTVCIVRTWEQPKCPSVDEWIKMYYIHTVEYYSATKRDKTEPSVLIVMRLGFVIQSDVSQEEKSTYHILMHVYVI